MRRILLAFIVLAALVSATVGAGAAKASTTIRLEVTLSESSCPGVLCGTGVVAGYGQASSTISVFDPRCTAQEPNLVTVTVVSGSLSWCQIGIDSVPHATGQAEPFVGTFTVIGGTGSFAGATGSGIQTAIWQFDPQTGELRLSHRHYNGTLTVP